MRMQSILPTTMPFEKIKGDVDLVILCEQVFKAT